MESSCSDNACPHTALLTKNLEFSLEILSHFVYSPDIPTSDYHLFLGLQNHLDSLRLITQEQIEQVFDLYFTSQPKELYKRDIYKLIDRRNQVIEQR